MSGLKENSTFKHDIYAKEDNAVYCGRATILKQELELFGQIFKENASFQDDLQQHCDPIKAVFVFKDLMAGFGTSKDLLEDRGCTA